MDQATMSNLATAVAFELDHIRSEGWRLDRMSAHGDAYPAAWLASDTDAVLMLQYGFESPGRVTVTGVFPKSTGALYHFSANVDPERGAVAIARAADRRVLEAGYLDVLPDMVALRARIDRQTAERETLLARAGALFGIDARDYGDGRKVYLTEVSEARGYVETYLNEPQSVTFNLSGIPAETALEMLAVLARDTRKATDSVPH